MKRYMAYGATYIEYLGDEGQVIGEDSGHRPVYYTWAESLEQAEEYPVEMWIETGDSNGTHGWTFYEDYTYDDKCDERVTVEEIYNIYETDSEDDWYNLKGWIETVKEIDC